MTDINELMKQAKQMQEQFKKTQEEIVHLVVQGESGAGMVKVEMNGRHDVVKLQLSDALMEESKEVIEDLVAAAVNDAVRKVEDKNKEKMAGMAGGFNLPEGFKLPF